MIGEYSAKQATTSVTESLSKRYQRLFKSKQNLFNKIHINSTDCAKAKAKITFKQYLKCNG